MLPISHPPPDPMTPMVTTSADRLSSGTRCRLEQFEGIPVRMFNLDLPSSWTNLHLVTKGHSGVLEGGDARGKVDHPQHHAVPTTGVWR